MCYKQLNPAERERETNSGYGSCLQHRVCPMQDMDVLEATGEGLAPLVPSTDAGEFLATLPESLPNELSPSIPTPWELAFPSCCFVAASWGLGASGAPSPAARCQLSEPNSQCLKYLKYLPAPALRDCLPVPRAHNANEE